MNKSISPGYKILITTSGIGSRLGEITKYINKALIRVGKKAVISYIIEKIPENIPIVITLGYKADLVKQYLALAHPDRIFEFVNIDPYDGKGSSLGYSMLQAKELLQCPFTYIASDTLFYNKLPLPDSNWIGVAEGKDNGAEYTTIDTKSNIAIKINPKGEINYDYVYIGLAGIFDYLNFWQNLESLFSFSPYDNTLNDAAAINEMIKQGKRFKVVAFNDWLDVGNARSLEIARKSVSDNFDNLEKNDEAIYLFDNDCVIKFFHNKKMIQNRLERTKHLKDLIPTILGYSQNFYKYRYVQGDLYSQVITPQSFPDFLNWCKNDLWKFYQLDSDKKTEFNDSCYNFYYQKTMQRLNQFEELYGINDSSHYINGEKIPSLSYQFKQINWNWVCEGLASTYHGDLHFENVIVTKDNNFCLLDWRQDFGGMIKYGDIYYDLAKLNHGMIISHDIIRKNLFFLKENDELIHCDILRPEILVLCQNQFYNFLKENSFDQVKVDLLTNLIFLNIAPLHHYPYSIFLYYFGKYRFWQLLKKTPSLKSIQMEAFLI